MFKKIVLACIAIAINSTALAATPYIGGSLGATDLGVSAGKINADAISKLFGGYGSVFGANNNIYLGGELNLDVAHYPSYTGTVYGLGASFIPGFMVTNDTMIYGRIGLEADRSNSSSTSHLGNQLGLGLQTSLAKNWDIRAEYVHTSTFNENSQITLGLVYKFD